MAWTAPQTWTTGETPTVTKLHANIPDNAKEIWREVGYAEFTATVTTSTHTEANPLEVVTAGSITFTAQPIIIEFFSTGWNPGGGNGAISLWDGVTDLGRLISLPTLGTVAEPVNCIRRLTPTAAAHAYRVMLWTTGGATAFVAASGGTLGNDVPGYIAIYQKGG